MIDKVAIFGASAGAHLGLTLLSHMSHPYPAIPELHLPDNLAAMVLLSLMTWTNVDTPSVIKNEAKDMIPKRLISEWTAMHGSDTGPNSYTEPAIAPAEWWKDTRVDKVLLLAGGDETLLDSCTEWANRFKVRSMATPSTYFFDFTAIDFFFLKKNRFSTIRSCHILLALVKIMCRQ